MQKHSTSKASSIAAEHCIIASSVATPKSSTADYHGGSSAGYHSGRRQNGIANEQQHGFAEDSRVLQNTTTQGIEEAMQKKGMTETSNWYKTVVHRYASFTSSAEIVQHSASGCCTRELWRYAERLPNSVQTTCRRLSQNNMIPA